MSRRPKKGPPAAVSELLTEITAWREQRRKPGRMPEELWSKATELGRAHGVSPVSRYLKLDYPGLKRRVFGEPAPDEKQAPAFVEIGSVEKGPVSSPCVEVITEMEVFKPGGATMRVRQSGPSGMELSGIVESFMRQR
jgi:hypothetical protein